MSNPPTNPAGDNSGNSILSGLNPDELFARGMQSVKMTNAGGLNSWEPPTVQEAARLFPNYEVVELIGRGGMGAVYKARQLALDRMVAIKLLPLEVSVDRDFAERFKREARTMAKMNHPHIVSVFDFGTTSEGHLFFVMEYVEGTTLHHIIKTTGLMPPQALEIIVGVCEALNYAHSEGVVHRDIKPANVLVDVRGRVKVTDFGLARLNTSTAEQQGYTMTGTVLGTPDYMAPEQKRGARVDHRADIYSLGVMLYEMLCGQVPQGIFDPPSIRIGVDERVDQVVIRAMQQEPDRRYQNTADMKQEVQTIRLTHDPNARAPQPRPVNKGGPQKSSPVPMIAGIAAAVVVAVGATVFILRSGDKDAGKVGVTEPSTKTGTTEPATNNSTGTNPANTVAVIPEKPTPAPVAPQPPAPTPSPTPSVASSQPPPATPPPEVPPSTPPSSIPSTPSTSLTNVSTPPKVAPNPPPNVEIRSIPNPDMANQVAQIGGNNPTAVVPAVIVEPWRDSVQQGDTLLRERDPDGAVQAYERALDQAERATPAVSPLELARIHQKMGNIAAQRGSAAEARGSFEAARRELQRAKGKDATQMISEIDAVVRRLPRE